MKYFKAFKYTRKIGGFKGLCGYFWRSSKKACWLNEGRYGVDPTHIKITHKLFDDIILKYQNSTPSKEPITHNIFILWWSGWDNIPEVVSLAKKSVEKHYSDYNVIYLSKDNIHEYIDKDDMIYKLFLDKKIEVQHFSDYLRFYLIEKYGGFWFDATLFFTTKFDIDSLLDDKDFGSLYFSSLARNFYYQGISSKWSDFFYAGRKHSVIARAFIECIQFYFTKYKYPYDYFMMDCILFVFMLNRICSNEMDRIIPLNGNCTYACYERGFDTTLTENDKIEINKVPQKLNWRRSYKKDKKDSIMYYLIDSLK